MDWHPIGFFLAVVGLAILWVFAQVFLFASFHIPSDSMEPELVEGDFVAVWKPVLGARLFNLNATLRLEQVEIHRVSGFRNIERNDILVFNFPHPNNWDKIEMHILKYYVKRCIGLPGDTLSIKNGQFRIEGVNEPLGNIASQQKSDRLHQKSFRVVYIAVSRMIPLSVGIFRTLGHSIYPKPVTSYRWAGRTISYIIN